MVFSSVIFMGIFLPIVLILYFLAKKRKTRNFILLLTSLLFYAWGEPRWIAAMLVLTYIDYLFASRVNNMSNRSRRKLFLGFVVFANLLILFIVKYFDFFMSSINKVTKAHLPLLNISMPIGISFFTFQALTYVVDVYRGDAEVQKSYLDLLLYISMFPQLIAGPIVRYSDIDRQIQNRQETLQGFINGMFRFSVGLGKKVLFANYAGNIATSLLTNNFDGISTHAIWIGIFMFTLQLYFDFAGYSDMAIGLGKVFGFDYKENFNYPYMANSITDFWRRWHISLGSFFRDYVYIPLGGNRKRQYFNTLVVWMLTGLWHGASWNFVIWGLFFAILLMVERNLKQKAGIDISKIPVTGNILVMIIITYSMSLFYFVDIHEMFIATRTLFGIGSNITMSLVERTIVYKYVWSIPFMVLACTPLPANICSRIFKQDTFIGNVSRSIMFCGLYILCFVLIINQTYNPFLYFRF